MNKPKLPRPKSEDEGFITDSKSALLDTGGRVTHIVLYVIAFLIVLGLVWAYFAPIDQVTVGEGKVIPSSKVKIIQSLDGGIVTDIPVSEGQLVKAGQILMKLDDTRYSSDYYRDYAQYVALSAMVARLTTEAYDLSDIKFPTFLRIHHADLVAREKKLFETRKLALKQALAVFQHDKDLSNEEIAMYKKLVPKGYVSKVDLLRSQLRGNEAQSKYLAKKDQFREDAWTELNKRKADLATVEASLKSLHDKMIHTVIRSPINGVVKKLNVVTIGGTIAPNMNIMEIVPINDNLLVEARVLPHDIAFVHIGQAASVKITAYDYTVYGGLMGKIEYISADAIEEQKTPDKIPQSYYIVHVRTQRNYLGSERHKLLIIPGMTATVHIVTGKKTVLEYLLKPLIKAKEEALRER